MSITADRHKPSKALYARIGVAEYQKLCRLADLAGRNLRETIEALIARAECSTWNK